MRLSFKQYLQESKTKLLSALESTPRLILEYDIKNYCSLATRDSSVDLKPRMKIIIEWETPNKMNPLAIQIESATNVQNISVNAWTSNKLHKWLATHTRGERNREFHTNKFQ